MAVSHSSSRHHTGMANVPAAVSGIRSLRTCTSHIMSTRMRSASRNSFKYFMHPTRIRTWVIRLVIARSLLDVNVFTRSFPWLPISVAESLTFTHLYPPFTDEMSARLLENTWVSYCIHQRSHRVCISINFRRIELLRLTTWRSRWSLDTPRHSHLSSFSRNATTGRSSIVVRTRVEI